MTPPDDAEVAIEGEAKVANGIQADRNVSTLVQATSNLSFYDQFLDRPGCHLTDFDEPIQVPPNETIPVFERFSKAFIDGQDGRAENTYYTPNGALSSTVSIYGQLAEQPATELDDLPYSYMVEHPGQMSNTLLSPEQDRAAKAWVWKICHPQHVARVPIAHYHAYNIEGEKALEREIKSRVPDPMTYLIIVRGFKLLMGIRNMTIDDRAVVDARTIGLLIGRLFCGDPATLKIFNKHFLPENLEIVPDNTGGAIRKIFEHLCNRFTFEPAARTTEVAHLLRLLKYFDETVRQGVETRYKHAGKLMVVKSYTDLDGEEVEVPHGGTEVPAGPELPRCLGVSPAFMAHYSAKWPFRVLPGQVDVCRLLDKDPVRWVQETETVCPRRIEK